MKCDQCEKELLISSSKLKTELNSVDIYSVQTLVCTNPKCNNYCGVDLNKPAKIAKIIENKI